MKKSILRYLTIGATFAVLASSCTDYLEREEDSIVDSSEAFKNYTNFQGFVEIMYNAIPNKESNMWCCTFNWGEDEIMNSGLGDSHVTAQFDLGNYRNWYQNNQSFLHADGPSLTSTDKYGHSIESAWECIRIANMGLANLDQVSATKKQRNALEGQLKFFRAWWHEEQMIWFGGIPYINELLDVNEDYALPRLTFVEDADLAYKDFMDAADLLPSNWDASSDFKDTKGHNDLRVTKAVAYAYAGKVMLWAASPLNKLGHGELGGKNTYNYDADRAGKAADALKKALEEIESGASPYALADYSYATPDEISAQKEGWEGDRGIYDHTFDKTKGSTNYSDIFRTTGQNWKMPGSVEAMMRGPMPDINGSNWNFAKLWGTKLNSIVEHDAVIHNPTANYINYAYGMANGEPIVFVQNGEYVMNPNSGFDPSHPFANRDPRFYHDIVFDGFRYINSSVDGADKPYQYVEMFTGGSCRDEKDASRTGYYCQKLVPHQCNKYDGMYNWGGALQTYLPYMRVAEVYLMYAEACAAAGRNAEAVNAINVLRDRVGAGHVADAYQTGNALMDEVRRERACELAYEGYRWNDLQRWLLLTEKPYTIKTSQEFARAEEYDYAKKDPRNATVAGWSEKVIVERNYQIKHYLLPFKQADVTLYQEFEQNPGW